MSVGSAPAGGGLTAFPAAAFARWLHRRLVLKWAGYLAAAYALSWASLFAINLWAVAAVERKFVADVRWSAYRPTDDDAPVQIMATVAALDDGRLKKAEVGCLGSDLLPPALGGAGSDFWKADPALSRELGGRLFPDPGRPETKIEDPFDEFFVRRLGFLLRPIAREKKLRDDSRFDVVLDRADKDDRERLLRHFGNTYGEFLRLFPCRVIRWTNGWVQVLAVAACWLAVVIVGHQYLSHVSWEWCQAMRVRPRPDHRGGLFPFVPRLANRDLDPAAAPADDALIAMDDIDAELEALEARALAADPGIAVQMLYAAYEGFKAGTVNKHLAAGTSLDQVADRLLRKRESDMAALVYLGWSLPSLGFVGTVLGLGTALLTAGDIVTPVSELQRDAIQTVSIYLGRAFDKTFVALLLSLGLMALIYWVRWAQESVVHTFHDRVARHVIPRLAAHGPTKRGGV